jgi:zinc protease
MLNRTFAPELREVDKIHFLTPRIYDISPFAKLYFMKEVPNETARLDLHFDAGNMHGEPGIANLVNGLLLSGTDRFSSTEIHNRIDALGGFFETGIVNEGAVVSIYCLRENLLAILDIVKDAIQHLAFHEHEVHELVNERKQKLKVSLEKVGVLAQRAFQQRVFSDTPYGRVLQEHTYDNLDITDLKTFFRERYLQGLTKVVVVADLPEDDIDRIIDSTGQWAIESDPAYEKHFSNIKGSFYEVREQALQSAIRIGRILFNKNHPDMHDMLILNTVLGDYFGSRLMSNLREDKGFTYGIGSGLAELNETGYFVIVTEVGKEVKEEALAEIQCELNRLQTELIGENELNVVKKYMLGQLLKSADGPYHAMDLFLGVEPLGLDFSYYNEHINAIKTVTPERLREVAKKYLNWSDMTIVTAG